MELNTLMTLVKNGENENVDFKLDLRLDTAEQKAEFVKDIISLVNSANELGYLIIGIDNKANFIGITVLEEERIQQIIHTYIYPNIIVRCYKVEVGTLLIGVIEVQGVEKPHRVLKSIDRLAVHEVFIRHGSVIAKASPDELFRMRENQTELQREIQQLIQAGERHLRIGNIDQSINAYSKAIEILPTVDTLLARATAYRSKFELSIEDYLDTEIGRLAFKDLSDAFLLSNSAEVEDKIKLERIELLSICPIEDQKWDEDMSWAFSTLQGTELGKISFYIVRRMNFQSIYTNKGWDSFRAMRFLERAIDLGYRDSQVYYFMAEIHKGDMNYGLAIDCINDAIKGVEVDSKLLKEYLNLRIFLQIRVQNYYQALIDLKKMKEIDIESASLYVWDSFPNLEKDIYYRVCLLKRQNKNNEIGVFLYILRLLVLRDGLPMNLVFSDGAEQTIMGGSKIEERYPDIAQDLKRIVGDYYWQSAKNGNGFSVDISTVKRR